MFLLFQSIISGFSLKHERISHCELPCSVIHHADGKHSAEDSRWGFNFIVVETFSCISLFKWRRSSHLRHAVKKKKIRKPANMKMIRSKLWLKLIWLCWASQWLQIFWRFSQMPLRVSGFRLHADYNQWIGMCVSSFYAESWSIFTVPFSTAWSWRWTVASG